MSILRGPLSVHIWGFFDDRGKPKLPCGVAPSDLGVYAHTDNLRRHIWHFGGDVEHMRITRPIDGGPIVETQFESSEREGCDRMWHVVTRPQSEWPYPLPRAKGDES